MFWILSSSHACCVGFVHLASEHNVSGTTKREGITKKGPSEMPRPLQRSVGAAQRNAYMRSITRGGGACMRLLPH